MPRAVRAGAGGARHRGRRAPRRRCSLRRRPPSSPPTAVAAAPSAGRRRRAAARPAIGRCAARRVGASTRRASTTTAPHGGYEALRRAFELGPAGVIREVTDVRSRRPRRRRVPDRTQVGRRRPPAGRPHYLVVQRRRVRARHVQGPGADGGRSVRGDRGDDDRRLRRPGASTGASTCAASTRGRTRRCSAAIDAAAPPRLPRRRRRSARGFALRHRVLPRRGRLHLRRGDGDLQLDRGLPRRAAQQAAVPGRGRPVRPADGRQQRRDAGQRAADHPGRRRVRAVGTRLDRPKLFCVSGAVAPARRLRGAVRAPRCAS